MIVGKQTTSARVDAVQPASAAQAAGFKPGDLVMAIDGEKIDSFADMQRIVSVSAGETAQHRGRARRRARHAQGDAAAPRAQGQFRQRAPARRARHQPFDGARRYQDAEGGPAAGRRRRARRRPGSWSTARCPISAACLPAAKPPISSAARSASPRFPAQVATAGFVALMHLTAVLSVSIGLLNLFPIPLLDGGHLLFYGIEAVRGRPLSERAQEVGFPDWLGDRRHVDDICNV